VRTILFINWYNEGRPERAVELLDCLNKNLQNKAIDFVVNISDTPAPDSRVINAPYKDRLTFSDFFHCINQTIQPDDISIIANLDIFFDETIGHVKNITRSMCYALSRWEILPDGTKNHRQVQVLGDSQDVWIFKGKIRNMANASFHLGKLGCDNRIAHEIKQAGYLITNPSKTIKAWHLHNSGIRNYDPVRRNAVPPPYHRIKPHAL
jgi:hypothetical protein